MPYATACFVKQITLLMPMVDAIIIVPNWYTPRLQRLIDSHHAPFWAYRARRDALTIGAASGGSLV